MVCQEQTLVDTGRCLPRPAAARVATEKAGREGQGSTSGSGETARAPQERTNPGRATESVQNVSRDKLFLDLSLGILL